LPIGSQAVYKWCEIYIKCTEARGEECRFAVNKKRLRKVTFLRVTGLDRKMSSEELKEDLLKRQVCVLVV